MSRPVYMVKDIISGKVYRTVQNDELSSETEKQLQLEASQIQSSVEGSDVRVIKVEMITGEK